MISARFCGLITMYVGYNVYMLHGPNYLWYRKPGWLWTDLHFFHKYLHNDELNSRFHMGIRKYHVRATHIIYGTLNSSWLLHSQIFEVCSQKPISPFLSIFKYGHHRIIQKIIFKMIPRSLHIKNNFWSYDQKYQKFSYYFLYISAASIANISIWQKWTYRFLRTNSSFTVKPCRKSPWSSPWVTLGTSTYGFPK